MAHDCPAIALSIPDFEGEAILRIFANSTQEQIACFSAVVTNGSTFRHPEAIGTILGIFTIVAIVASFATAVYGEQISVMRKHYAHSLSVMVVFAVFHHIYYTGALSMNWPSVLVAFWSNYAWAGGMIYSEPMQNAINKFIGTNRGNTTAVGAAQVGFEYEGLGGGYDITKIYKRALNVPGLMRRSKYNLVARKVEGQLARRALANGTDGYNWYGSPVKPGLPLPGNFSGFAGTLGEQDISASNAFLTGLIWFAVLILIVAGSVVIFKFILEGLIKIKRVRSDRLLFFRSHWLGYTGVALLRTLFIGFFVIMFLTMFQFTYKGATAVIAIAAVAFALMFIAMFGIAFYALFFRIKFAKYISEPDRILMERTKVFKFVPWVRLSRASSVAGGSSRFFGSLPFWRIAQAPTDARSIHEDDEYTKKFGWLTSRFRRTRWWFFAIWLAYEFVRACFFAAASGYPVVQVFALLVIEFVAFVAIILIRPFEGQRLNAILVYALGFSKVSTVALSSAFDVRFGLARIPATVIGVIIIVIQSLLTLVLIVAVVVGAISSYMSVLRNREDFRPVRLAGVRQKYYGHLDASEKDLPPVSAADSVEEPKGPHFNVNSVRRMAKIEDEDAHFQAEINGEFRSGHTSLQSLPIGQAYGSKPEVDVITKSRAPSVYSNLSHSSLPFGARMHRGSWSSKDFAEFQPDKRRSTNLTGNTPFMASRESFRSAADRITSPLATHQGASYGDNSPRGAMGSASPVGPVGGEYPARPKSGKFGDSGNVPTPRRPALHTLHSSSGSDSASPA